MTTKPTITLITPTRDQPLGMQMLEFYMDAQTVKFDNWIVVDDGVKKAELNCKQDHIQLPSLYKGAKSLATNMLHGLTRAARYDNDIILIIEHDDFYAPNHIETQVGYILDGAFATGCKVQRYYNVQHRMWIELQNVGSSLCNTAFRKSALPMMQMAAQQAYKSESIGLDRIFWDQAMRQPETRDSHIFLHNVHTVVGIKGLPGQKGLGMGHRPLDRPARFTFDPRLEKLVEWTGSFEAANHYAAFWNHANEE